MQQPPSPGHVQPDTGKNGIVSPKLEGSDCFGCFPGFSLGKVKDENTLCFIPHVQIVICLGNGGARENDNSKELEELQVCCCHGTCVNLSLMTFHSTTPAGARPDTSFAGYVHG